MVEFPLVVWPGAKGFAPPVRNLSQTPGFADINFVSSSRRPTQADMWETNTFPASFHARLNVARRLSLPRGKRRRVGKGALAPCPPSYLACINGGHAHRTLRVRPLCPPYGSS